MSFMKKGIKVNLHPFGFIVFAHGDFEIVQIDCNTVKWTIENGEIVVDAFNDYKPVKRWRKPIDDVGANRGNFLQGIR